MALLIRFVVNEDRSSKQVDNAQTPINLLAVLHIFRVKGIAARFQRGSDNKAVIPGKTVPIPDIEGDMDGKQRYDFHPAHRLKRCYELADFRH